MDTSFLGTEEPVILTVAKIIVGGIRHEAALTEKRFLLADEAGTIINNIPFSSLSSISSGENGLREPVLSLTYTSPSGEMSTLELIFARSAGGINVQDRDRFLGIMGSHGVSSSAEIRTPGSEAPSHQTAQEWAPSPYLKKETQTTGSPEDRSSMARISAIIIIIIVIIGIAFIYPMFSPAGSPVPRPVTPAPFIQPPPGTTMKLPETTAAPVTSPSLKPAPEPVSAEGMIPKSGVFVRVRYPGTYSGYVGANGYALDVNSSGTRIYQIPVRTGMIEGSVGKQDASGDPLDVAIYLDSVLVFLRETTSPRGVIDFHVPLPQPGDVISPTLAPVTPVITLPPREITLPDISIPGSGTWVRVYYPGNFTGSVGSGGMLDTINSTGDQLYQIPLQTGMIEGSVQKQDGSGEPLVVAIYHDGSLVSRLFTVAPHGVVDLHVTVEPSHP